MPLLPYARVALTFALPPGVLALEMARKECTWDPPIEVQQGNPQLAKRRPEETPETTASPGLAEQPGARSAGREKDEESEDREEANGDVPGGDDATGLEIVVIPSKSEKGASFDLGDNFDCSLGEAPSKESKVRPGKGHLAPVRYTHEEVPTKRLGPPPR